MPKLKRDYSNNSNSNDKKMNTLLDLESCISNLRNESKMIKEKKSFIANLSDERYSDQREMNHWSSGKNTNKDDSYLKNSSFVIKGKKADLENDSMFKD